MSYACKILADSLNPIGHRLTTFEVTFPRFILAELNTHRMLSRNSASSRAIPTESMIERVTVNPFVPEFNGRVKGMGVGEALDPSAQASAVRAWLRARSEAVRAARGLLHVDKSRANRLLEPFMWHTAIVSATEWENFWQLRDHEAAQPEFRKVASMMRCAQAVNTPSELGWGEWHLPLVFREDFVGENPERFAAEVSAGRCGRVSYDRQHDSEHRQDSAGRWYKMADSGHWSPGEHPARSFTREEWACVVDRQRAERRVRASEVDEAAIDAMEFVGNYRGFVQLRKHYPGEAVFHGAV